MIYFAFDDDPGSDTYNLFLVVKQDFWEQYGHLDDEHIAHFCRLPEGFCEVQESMFEYDGPIDEGRKLLLEMGYKEEKKLLP